MLPSPLSLVRAVLALGCAAALCAGAADVDAAARVRKRAPTRAPGRVQAAKHAPVRVPATRAARGAAPRAPAPAVAPAAPAVAPAEAPAVAASEVATVAADPAPLGLAHAARPAPASEPEPARPAESDGVRFDPGTPARDTASASAGEGHGADSDRCLLGNLCFGPVLSLGAVNAIGGGGHLRFARWWGLGFDVQLTPMMGPDAFRVGTSSLAVTSRVYPFGKGFFLAGGFGRQTVDVHVSQLGYGADASITVTGVQLGLGYMGGSGFVIGIDAALLVPMQRSPVAITGITGAPGPEAEAIARGEAGRRVDALVAAVPVVPQLNLLRLGYLF